MLRKLRSHLSYANVVATLALVLAVGGGTAYAAAKIRSSDIGYHAVTASKLTFNAVTASKVKNSALSGKDLRDSSIATADVRNGTLRSEDFAAGQLPQGPKGDQGAPATELHGTLLGGRSAHERPGRHRGERGRGRHVHRHVQPGREQVRDRRRPSPRRRRRRRHRDRRAQAGAPQQVTFRTRDAAGASAQRPFHFAVFC